MEQETISLTQKVSSFVGEYFTLGMIGLAGFGVVCMLLSAGAAGLAAVILSFLAGGMFFAFFKNSC